jgi:hypothetical protein
VELRDWQKNHHQQCPEQLKNVNPSTLYIGYNLRLDKLLHVALLIELQSTGERTARRTPSSTAAAFSRQAGLFKIEFIDQPAPAAAARTGQVDSICGGFCFCPIA